MLRKNGLFLFFGLIFVIPNIFSVSILYSDSDSIISQISINSLTELEETYIDGNEIINQEHNSDILISDAVLIEKGEAIFEETEDLNEVTGDKIPNIEILPNAEDANNSDIPSNKITVTSLPIIAIYEEGEEDEEYVTKVIIDNLIVVEDILILGDDIIVLIDELIEVIQLSDDCCWRKPATNRQNTMIQKLTALKDFVSANLWEDAYNKTLHDIKPKLTGSKTNEDDEPWGNEIFKNPWVICEALQGQFRVICDAILSKLKNPEQPM